MLPSPCEMREAVIASHSLPSCKLRASDSNPGNMEWLNQMTTMTSVRQWWKSRLSPVQIARRDGRNLASDITWGRIMRDQPTILAMDRGQFAKDIEAMRQRTALNWATISASHMRKAQENWVSAPARQQTYFTRSLRHEHRDLLPLLAAFGLAFLEAASARTPIAAVLSANVDYWQDEAIKIACSTLGIPFLVLCRENRTIPWTTP